MPVVDVRGAPTIGGKQLFRDVARGVVATGGMAFFRIGEGGFVTQPGGLQVPADPDDTGLGYSSLDDVVAQGVGVNGLFRFQKTLTLADLTIDGQNVLYVRCLVDYGEANDNGLGAAPKFYELGVYDTNQVLVAYGTFPEEEKTPLRQIERRMKLTF